MDSLKFIEVCLPEPISARRRARPAAWSSAACTDRLAWAREV